MQIGLLGIGTFEPQLFYEVLWDIFYQDKREMTLGA